MITTKKIPIEDSQRKMRKESMSLQSNQMENKRRQKEREEKTKKSIVH